MQSVIEVQQMLATIRDFFNSRRLGKSLLGVAEDVLDTQLGWQ